MGRAAPSASNFDGSARIARLRQPFDAKAVNSEQAAKTRIAEVQALPRLNRMGLHVFHHAHTRLSHCGHIEDVQVRTAKHHAGQGRDRKFDRAVDAPVRCIADDSTADDLRVPYVAFRVDRAAVRAPGSSAVEANSLRREADPVSRS